MEKQINDPNSILSFYKRIIELRKENDILKYGKTIPIDCSNESIFAYKRVYKRENIYVIANFTDKKVSNSINIEPRGIILSNYSKLNHDLNKGTLSPYEVVVFT